MSLKGGDYFRRGKSLVLRLITKGGKEKETPGKHMLEEILDSYLSGFRVSCPYWSSTSDNAREKSGAVTKGSVNNS